MSGFPIVELPQGGQPGRRPFHLRCSPDPRASALAGFVKPDGETYAQVRDRVEEWARQRTHPACEQLLAWCAGEERRQNEKFMPCGICGKDLAYGEDLVLVPIMSDLPPSPGAM